MARYRLTPAAQFDLELIWDYTFENFGSNQALIYTDGIDSACRLLAEAPLINRPRPEYNPEVRIYPQNLYNLYKDRRRKTILGNYLGCLRILTLGVYVFSSYVRVQLDGTNALSLAEVEVVGRGQ